MNRKIQAVEPASTSVAPDDRRVRIESVQETLKVDYVTPGQLKSEVKRMEEAKIQMIKEFDSQLADFENKIKEKLALIADIEIHLNSESVEK